ncbi:ABC transporter ATP-binding protein [Rubellimicrobium mesophilum DSM 19309]|uniref:ABC transporter ATP-binding protein n=1 Tax=Rubellimicrobium mesophilum DSM 19309 TaxID=442562 RepID=A0A017HS66_9RHOB|nr:ABC transporter ATP-binding protein [Rubellimicrobium mesophilum]EYD77231.1 ABC transporter ATP-binding protein [Rubellimicrobium mesophilum DSM 19309]
MSSLTIHDLRKSFGAVEVLKDINLEARPGEFIALVGPSGCGKSTLLAMIAGLESVSSGEIRIDGRLVNDVAPRDRDIAMVFQSYALYPTMTVKENMAFGMESRGVPKADQEKAIARVASLLQIEPLLRRKPAQLSGGQRQRVAMGRALVRDPKLFLFDEPLSNLDAKLRVEMRTEIKKLHHRVAKTTIYVTHDQIEAMTLASRIAVMHKGVLQQFDEPQVIYERPANIFVAGFMGSPSMNFLAARTASLDGAAAVALDLPEGESVLPLPTGTKPQKAPGQPVILGIRPEHFTVAHRAQPGQTALGRLRLPVEVVEPTGSETMVVLRAGDTEITARYEPADAPKVGQTADLLVDMAKACLFDPVTEARL